MKICDSTVVLAGWVVGLTNFTANPAFLAFPHWHRVMDSDNMTSLSFISFSIHPSIQPIFHQTTTEKKTTTTAITMVSIRWHGLASLVLLFTTQALQLIPGFIRRKQNSNSGHDNDVVRFEELNGNTDVDQVATIHNHFMEMALSEAKEAGQEGEVPIGAVLVEQLGPYDYRVLAKGRNRIETDWDASAHAEMVALRSASKRIQNWRLLNTTLYSTLEPCPMCLAACQAFRIGSLVYGAPDLRLGAVETHIRLLDAKHPAHNISDVVKDVSAEKSAELLKQFFKERRKKQQQGKKKMMAATMLNETKTEAQVDGGSTANQGRRRMLLGRCVRPLSRLFDVVRRSST